MSCVKAGCLEEVVERVGATCLRRARLAKNRATHLAINEDAHADMHVRPAEDLVCHQHGDLQDFPEACVEAHAHRHILGEVPILQVGHELAVLLDVGMGEAW